MFRGGLFTGHRVAAVTAVSGAHSICFCKWQCQQSILEAHTHSCFMRLAGGSNAVYMMQLADTF